MSYKDRTYDENHFKESIQDAVNRCDEIRNDIRHYKMHLMESLLQDYIKIDAHGTVHSPGKNAIHLKDILSPDNGITAGPIDLSIYRNSITTEGVPLLIKDYFMDQRFHADNYNYIDPRAIKTFSDFLVRGGDILMIKKGEQAGSCTVMPLDHAESLLGPECIKITIMHDRYDVFYIINLLHLYYYHNVSFLRSEAGIKIDKLLTLPIAAIDLEKQKEIARLMLEFSAYMVAQDVYRDQMKKLMVLINDAER